MLPHRMPIPPDLHKRLVDTASGYAIFALDAQGRVISWNDGARELKQYDAAEIIGIHFSVFYTPADRDGGLPESALATARTIGKIEQDGWRVRKDGSRFWANVVLTALRDDDGRLFGFSKVTRDLTARFEAEERQLATQREFLLAASAERAERLMLLEAAVEGTTEGVLILAGELIGEGPIVVYANPVASRITGYPVHELLGAHVRKLINGPQSFTLSAERMAAQLVNGLAAAGRIPQYRRDGTEFMAEWAVSPIAPTAGGLRHYIAVVRDVSDRAQLEEQFLQAQKMEAVGRLAGGIAHDFNNLLTIIIANARMLQRVPSVKDLPGALDEIRAAGERASALTRQLLTFSRKQSPELITLDLNATVLGIFGLLRRVLGEDIEITTELARGLPSVHGDAGQMEQVLMNLAVNARDAMPGGGKLTITTALGDRPDTVVISVADSGAGMDDATKRHLFEPFFTTKEIGKGTGLGLATVYGIVRQMGGEITVESERGEGARFDVTLPCEVEATEAAIQSTPYRYETEGTGQVILLAEDEPTLRRIVRHILASSGYQVVEAENATAALAKSERMDSIDLLVTDVVMPGMRGSALAARLRRTHAGLRVLYMSGYTHDVAVERDSDSQGTAFLEKPFDDRELLRAVHAILAAPGSVFSI